MPIILSKATILAIDVSETKPIEFEFLKNPVKESMVKPK